MGSQQEKTTIEEIEDSLAEAIKAKYDKDIKAAAVRCKVQISLLSAQRDDVWH